MGVLVYLFFVLGLAGYAREEGRSGLFWGAIGLMLTPLFGGILYYIINKSNLGHVLKNAVLVVLGFLCLPFVSLIDRYGEQKEKRTIFSIAHL